MTDRARVEAAVANALPAGVSHAEVDDEDASGPLAKARDLSLAELTSASTRTSSTRPSRAVAAWADAVDGDDAAFARVARPGLLQELLYPPDGGRSLRLVVGRRWSRRRGWWTSTARPSRPRRPCTCGCGACGTSRTATPSTWWPARATASRFDGT
jgi:hypothetical protein